MKKRLFDIIVSALGLIALAPAFITIAAWIKFDSPGPVIFRQQRVGRNGMLFEIAKFRTMHCHSDTASQLTAYADSRITNAGRILRRYKVDELPQLFNVLTGSMSLVGPRPEVPRYVNLYPPDIRALVLSVAPGITDWAAIKFKDEDYLLAGALDTERTYIDTILPIKLAYYVRYIKEHTFLSDMHIIACTAFSILH